MVRERLFENIYMVIAKFLSSTVTLTGYFIFVTTIQTILSTNLTKLCIDMNMV